MEATHLKALRRGLFGIPASKSICRSLFGDVDHEEIKAELERERLENIKTKSQLWNFDFEDYKPTNKSNQNGLKWVACPSQISEYTIQPGKSLVTSVLTTKKSKCVRKMCVVDKTNGNQIKRQRATQKEGKVIRIVNASPPRPKVHNENIDVSMKNQNEIISQSSPIGRQKRFLQPTIDDYMKKKKPRVALATSKILRQEQNSISTRLRNSCPKISA